MWEGDPEERSFDQIRWTWEDRGGDLQVWRIDGQSKPHLWFARSSTVVLKGRDADLFTTALRNGSDVEIGLKAGPHSEIVQTFTSDELNSFFRTPVQQNLDNCGRYQ